MQCGRRLCRTWYRIAGRRDSRLLLARRSVHFTSALTTCQAYSYEVSYHASHAPHIGTRAPLGSQDDFRRTVLSCLNIVCEVVADPACVAQICNLHRNDIHAKVAISAAALALEVLGFRRMRAAEIHVGNVVGEYLSITTISHLAALHCITVKLTQSSLAPFADPSLSSRPPQP